MSDGSAERIAITGIGMVTTLGRDATETFRRLVKGDVGIAKGTPDLGLPAVDSPVGTACFAEAASVPICHDVMPLSRSDALACAAAKEALAQAGLGNSPVDLLLGETTGASREAVLDYAKGDSDDATPFLRRMVLEPLGASGPQLKALIPQIISSVVVCSACSSGALAIALGAMRLEQGAAVPQLVGGTDALNALTLVGFGSLGALSNEPCRPFDAQRKGLNLGEGAAFLLLETETMVRRRAGTVLAWLDGYAIGAEAHHLTHPDAEGSRASALISDALRRAGVAASDVGYINAHGTATLANDAMEAKAILRVFGEEKVHVSSSKGQLGHTLGAAGALEAALVVQALRDQVFLPTAGLTEIATECLLTHVLGQGKPGSFDVALSTSFGFGGAGAVVALTAANRVNQRVAPTPPFARVFVKTAVTLGSAGILRGIENADLVNDASAPTTRQLPFEPLDLLVMERSRRFDRLTALAALGSSLALEEAGIDGKNTGLVLGNALGDVSRSVEFIKRVRARGLRGAHPAEFPHLLPSSVSGNASIYAGLEGPVFNVSVLGQTAEVALELAVNCLHSGVTGGMLTGTVEVLDQPVCATLIAEDLLSAHAPLPTEGAAFLLLEADGASSAPDSRRCELVWAGKATDCPRALLASRRTLSGCEVLWASGDEGAMSAYLESLGFGDVARRTVNARVGSGWHLSAFLYATAAARVLAELADSVLVVTDPAQGRHLALFARG